MNAVVREIVDPSPVAAVRAAEQAHVEAHAAANAAIMGLNEADRALGSAEKELNALLHRPTFEKPRKEQVGAAMAKIAASRQARDDAKEDVDKAKTLMAWRVQEVAKARRQAYEPAKAAAIARMVELAERADAKRAELDAIGAEFDAAATDLQAALQRARTVAAAAPASGSQISSPLKLFGPRYAAYSARRRRRGHGRFHVAHRGCRAARRRRPRC